MHWQQTKANLILFVFLSRCELLLDMTSAQTSALGNQETLSSVQLKEIPGCRDQVLPAMVKEWQQLQESVISVEWTYVGSVSYPIRHAY